MKLSENLPPNFTGKLLTKLPLINFLLAALLGVMLRYYFIHPVPGFNYKNWLQVHSHVMFLGWITLALFVMIIRKLSQARSQMFKFSIVIFQLSVLALFISFPAGGYGIGSVIALTICMAASILVMINIFKGSKEDDHIGWKYIKSGLFFMVFSCLGPLALGPITALGMKNTPWHDFAIYFYLHFQYNGWFFLAILGLVILDLPAAWMKNNLNFLQNGWYLPIVAVFLTYFLSLLDHGYSLLFNLLGGLGAAAQLTYVILFLVKIKRSATESDGLFSGKGSWLFQLSIMALLLKLCLQLLSALPVLASFAFSHRNIIIAFLHLTLIGFVSFFILDRYREEKWISQGVFSSVSIMVLISGFLLNEFVLVISVTGGIILLTPYLLFIASLLMVIGITGLIFNIGNSISPGINRSGLIV
jgi:hypothetical protein